MGKEIFNTEAQRDRDAEGAGNGVTGLLGSGMKVYHQTEHGVIYHGDCLEIMKGMPDMSVDAVITDPPYGLLKHAIETNVYIDAYFHEAFRVGKANTFTCFFGQMPTLVDWIKGGEANGFKYKEHVVWVKRVNTCPFLPLARTHESFMIMSKGKAQYFETKGKYEDVKVPGIMYDVVSTEAIKRYINHLWKKISDGTSLCNSRKRYIQANPDGIFKASSVSDTSPREANFTSVWSFLSENQRERTTAREGEFQRIKHPTVKSKLFMERAARLCCVKDGVVLDPFGGSGSTALGCILAGRKYILIEIDERYCEIAAARIEKEIEQQQIDLGDGK